MRGRIVLLLLVVILVGVAAAEPHAQFRQYSAVENVSFSDGSLTVMDTLVYHQGWYSVNGSGWVPFELSGVVLPNAGGMWLAGESKASLPAFGVGEHYVAVYSCSLGEDVGFDCHDTWQLLVINVAPRAPTCDDGLQNQGEEGVDCGSPCGPCEDVVALPEGIVHWWPLDGDAQDEAGANHGAPSSGLALTTQGCISGQCYSFDGDDDVIQLMNAVTLTDGSYSFWIARGDDLSDDRVVLGSDSAYSRIFLRRENADLRLETDTNGQEFQFYGHPPSTDTSHVVLVRDGDSLGLYIDGVFRSSATRTFAVAGAPLTFDRLGMGGRSFRGSLDEVMVWDRPLTDEEVRRVYGHFMDVPPVPTCDDGLQNQGEEGVDCGGPCPSCDPPVVVAVTASTHLPLLTLDGVLSDDSYWAAEGDGQWVAYELSGVASVSFVELAFPYESSRYFSLEVSLDGASWSPVGPEFTSALDSAHVWQRFSFEPVEARYVRFLGHGSSESGRDGWNAVSGININGFAVDLHEHPCVPNANECGPDGCGGEHPACAAGSCVSGSCVGGVAGEPVVVFFNGFEQHATGGYGGRLDDWSYCQCNVGERIYQDAGDAENPSKVYRFFFPEGTVSLGGTSTDCDGFRCEYEMADGYDELYFSYRVKFEYGFQPNQGGKLPRIKGVIDDRPLCPKGDDFFTGGMMFGDYRPYPGPKFYLYHMDQWNDTHYLTQYYQSSYYKSTGIEPTSCHDFDDAGLDVYGDSRPWSDLPSMPTGHWYTVTERIVLNTPGQADGFAEGFIDGRLAMRITGLRFRTIDELKINIIEFVSFFGGSGPSWESPQDQYIYFDDLVAYYYPAGGDVPVGHEFWPDGEPLPSVPLPAAPVFPRRAS